MTRTENNQIKAIIEKYKGEVLFSFEKMLADIERIALKNVEFDKSEPPKAPW